MTTTTRGWPTTPRAPGTPTSSAATHRQPRSRRPRWAPIARPQRSTNARSGSRPTTRARSPSSTTATPTRWPTSTRGRRPPRRASAPSRSGTTSATPCARARTIASSARSTGGCAEAAESVAEISARSALLEPLGRRPRAGLRLLHRGLQPLADRRRQPPTAMLHRAHEMADRIGDPVVLSDVLNNVAFGELLERRDWTGPMLEALRIALEPGPRARPAAPTPTPTRSSSQQFRFPEAERFWRDGIAYCDERDITTYSTCLRGHRAVALLDVGRWDEAAAIAERVLATEASPVNLLTSQVTLGLIRARRGEGGRPVRGARPRGRGGRRRSTRPSGSACHATRAVPRRAGSPVTTTGPSTTSPRSGRDHAHGLRRRRPAERLGATPARRGRLRPPPPPSPGPPGSPATTPRRQPRGSAWAAATTPRWRCTTPTATTTCARRSARFEALGADGRGATYAATDEGPRPPSPVRGPGDHPRAPARPDADARTRCWPSCARA